MDDQMIERIDGRTGEIRTGGLLELGSDEALAKLYSALGKAQAAFGAIARTKTVKIESRERAGYSYDYAPLEDLLAATRKPLVDNGLVILTPIWRNEGEAQVLVVVAHEAGARIMVPFGFTPQAEIKGLGAQITYLRRYGYAAMLNLTADADAEEQPSEPANRSQKQSTQPQSKPPVPDKPTPFDLEAYQRGMKRAFELDLDLAPFEAPGNISRPDLVALSQKLKVAVDKAEAEKRKGVPS